MFKKADGPNFLNCKWPIFHTLITQSTGHETLTYDMMSNVKKITYFPYLKKYSNYVYMTTVQM